MKILHVNEGLHEGGQEQYIHQVCAELGALGHENAVLHGQPVPSGAPDICAQTHHVPHVTSRDCPDLPAALRRARHVVEEVAPDVILIHQIYPSRLVDYLTAVRPSVRFTHDVRLVCPENRKTLRTRTASGGPELCPHPLGWACQGRAYVHRCMPRNPFKGLPLLGLLRTNLALYKARSFMVAPSGFMRDMLLQNGFAPGRIEVIPHFTALPGGAPPAEGQGVLAVSRAVRGKGLSVLIDAMAQLKNPVRLVIAGDGPDLGRLKRQARERGLADRVHFAGWVPRQELDSLYAECAVVAVPSLCQEAFCMTGIEAMAHGRPVVGAGSGGIMEWLEDGVMGVQVAPGDAAALAKGLDRVLADDGLARSLGEAGRKRVRERFCARKHVEALVAVFERAVREFSPAAGGRA